MEDIYWEGDEIAKSWPQTQYYLLLNLIFKRAFDVSQIIHKIKCLRYFTKLW